MSSDIIVPSLPSCATALSMINVLVIRDLPGWPIFWRAPTRRHLTNFCGATTALRGSQLAPGFLHLDHLPVIEKQNAATDMASLIIPGVGSNYDRHPKLQRFMLAKTLRFSRRGSWSQSLEQ
jgi:hypothetical protein